MGVLNLMSFQVVHLATKGGRDVKDATRRIMSAFMLNALLLKLNWTGQLGGKTALCKLKSLEIIRSESLLLILLISSLLLVV
jgi:hypothetical protein